MGVGQPVPHYENVACWGHLHVGVWGQALRCTQPMGWDQSQKEHSEAQCEGVYE